MIAGDVRRLRALAALRLAEIVGGQRCLVPMVLFAVLVVVLVVNDPSPAPGPWPVTAPALCAASAWLTVAATGTGELRPVAAAAVGGPGRWVAATVVAATVLALGPVLLAVGLPAVLHGGFPPATVGGAVLAHVTAAVAGTAVGLVCAPPVVPRPGASAAAAFVVVVGVATTPWLPPVGTTVRAVDAGGVRPVDLVVAVLLLVAAGTVWWVVARRRG
ncbi:hypothetical protein [Actinomycetospora sp. CA-084318]|uniref:hypothetical protein n=1 Tax=Actinomycetospora sp. CA-084318 TaxID=3239892 RepID=UPI003D992C2D